MLPARSRAWRAGLGAEQRGCRVSGLTTSHHHCGFPAPFMTGLHDTYHQLSVPRRHVEESDWGAHWPVGGLSDYSISPRSLLPWQSPQLCSCLWICLLT